MFRIDVYAASKLRWSCIRILYFYQGTYDTLGVVKTIARTSLVDAIRTTSKKHRLVQWTEQCSIIGINKIYKTVTSSSLSLHNYSRLGT